MSTLDALQTALAAEHAALYAFGVLGARTSSSSNPAVFQAVSSAYAAHRGQRDALAREVTQAGGTPVAAESAYVVPSRLSTPAQVQRAALEVERAVATAYAWLVARAPAPSGRWRPRP